MEQKYLCLKCVHYKEEELEGYYSNVTPTYVKYYPPTIRYSCIRTGSAIIVLRTQCPLYISITQTKLKVVINGMVKLEDMEREGEKIELGDLPQEVELIAVSERYKEAADGKAAGLVIRFAVRDGRAFDQKYTKLSGQVLYEALTKLKVNDTTELQKTWYTYKLQPMSMGFPRMIPIKKAATQ